MLERRDIEVGSFAGTSDEYLAGAARGLVGLGWTARLLGACETKLDSRMRQGRHAASASDRARHAGAFRVVNRQGTALLVRAPLQRAGASLQMRHGAGRRPLDTAR